MTGKSYELNSIADVAALYRQLPAERGAVLLRELCEGVRYMAPITAIVEAARAEFSVLGPFTWTDDDKSEKTIRLLTEDGGEEALTFNFHPAAAPASDHETVEFGGRTYRKFIHHGEPVDDGTVRCIFCGQIDEDGAHDAALCPPLATPTSPTGEQGQ